MEEMGRLDRSVSWSKCPLWFGIIVNPKRARADRTEQIHLPVLPTRFGSCFIKTFLDFHVRPQTKEKQQLQRRPPQKKTTYIHFLRLFHPQILPLSSDPRLKWVKIRRCFQVALCVVSAEPFYLGYLFSESLGFLRRCRWGVKTQNHLLFGGWDFFSPKVKG